MVGVLSNLAEVIARLVRAGYPEHTAKKIATGELPMDEMSRMERAYDQGYLAEGYKGSTHDIGRLDASLGSVEGDMGQGIYSTNSLYDVNTNYAGEGPDLTNKIEREKERVADWLAHEDPEYILGDYDIPLERYEMDEEGVVSEIARKIAKGDNEGVVYPLKINTSEYAQFGGDNPTMIRTSYMDEATEKWKLDNPGIDPEDSDSFEDEIYDYLSDVENSDYGHPALRLREAIEQYGGDPSIADDLYFGEEGVDIQDIKGVLEDGYFEDYDNDAMPSSGQVLNSFLSDSGYKGIVDNTAPSKFAQMNAGTHTIAFPGGEDTVRSRFAAFDPENIGRNEFLGSLAAGAVGLGALAPEEAEAGPLQQGMRRIIDDRFLNALGGSNPRVGLRDAVAKMQTGITPRELNIGGEYNLWDFEGSPYILTQSDRSAAGGVIDSIHNTPISPVDLRGGRDFMFDPLSEGQVWASDPAVVRSLHKRAGVLSDEHGADTLLLPYSMAPTGIDFATMPLDTMVGYAREKMSKANIRKLDKMIKEVIPDWGGVSNPDSVNVFRDVKGPARKKVADLIDKNFRDARGGLSISEARAATSDASQYMTPEGQITNIGRIDSTAPVLQDSGHPTYVGGLPGEGVGRLSAPLDVRPFMANNGRQLTGDSADIRALSMNHGLSQGVIDEPLLRSIYGRADPRLLASMATGALGAAAFPLMPLQALGELEDKAKQGLAGLWALGRTGDSGIAAEAARRDPWEQGRLIGEGIKGESPSAVTGALGEAGKWLWRLGGF